MLERLGVAAYGVICLCIGIAWGTWSVAPAPPPDLARYDLELRLVEAATELGQTAHQHGRLCKEVYESLGFVPVPRMLADGH